MIVTKAILVKVSLEVFRRYGMIGTIDATLDQRPEALNRVHMVDTLGIDALAMLMFY